ncbi:hypothetical protein [Streptomyces sp. NPDC060205]|uniref:hypothetical protein n=1 Tax=Streptomyces sp. NPDC060205 TaxID=3347072 RepID=UPI00364D7BFF
MPGPGPAPVPGLSEAEQALWDAFPTGDVVDLGASLGSSAPRPGTVVRAHVIVRLLLGEREPAPGHVPALRLRRALVSGTVDLSGSDVPYPLVATDCVFEQTPLFEAASTKQVDLSGSQLPGLLLRDARVDGLLRLRNCRCDQPVRLTRAHVGGTLDLTAARLRGTPALHADSLVVERDLICRDAEVEGEMLMWSARIGGTLVAEGARVSHPEGATLNGDGLVVGAGLFGGDGLATSGHGLVSRGELRLQDARISRCCTLSGATLDNPGGIALNAERLHVEGLLALDGSFTARGPVVLAGASVQGPLRLAGATLDAPGGQALDASLTAIGGDLDASSGFSAEGQVLLEGARVEGSVRLAGARLHHPEGETLSARRMQVAGRVHCADLESYGQIVLTDATVGASVEFHGAHLTNPSGRTLTAWGLTAGGVVDCCHGFVSQGRVSLTGSRVGSALSLADATVDGPLSARNIRAAALTTDAATRLRGPVDLRHAHVEVLEDVPARWPDVLLLDGFVYDNMEVTLSVEDRLAWLAKERNGFLPQPYEQLAATYTRHGHDTAARTVLLAKHRHHRASQPPALRGWGYVQDWTVGYGFLPRRAAGWLLALLLVATVAFAVHHPRAAKLPEAPEFNPFLYALDLLLPVVSFGQEGAFNPGGWQQWFAATLIAAGWVLATTIATGITRTLSRR